MTVMLQMVLKAFALRLESVVSAPEVWRLSMTTAGKSNGNHGFLEVIASDFSKFRAGTTASTESSAATGPRAFPAGARNPHAMAGKSQRIIGLPEGIERLRLQVRVIGILDCVRQWSLILVIIHLGVLLWLPVHVSLRCLVFLRLPPHLLLLLRLLLLLQVRAPHPCTLQSIRGRTRVGYRVPREGGVPKVGFPVRLKICALSHRWRQG